MGSFDPPVFLAFFQSSFQDRPLDIFGDSDIAGHDEKFQKKALLGKNIRHCFLFFTTEENRYDVLSKA